MNFKSLCILTMKNWFLEGGIIKSGFLLAFVFSLFNSLTSDSHPSPLSHHVWYSQEARENLCSVAGYRAGLRSGEDINLQVGISPCERNWGPTLLWNSLSWGCQPAHSPDSAGRAGQGGQRGDGDQWPMPSYQPWAEMVSWAMGRESWGIPEEVGGSGPDGALGPLSLGWSNPCSGLGWEQLSGNGPGGSWWAWRDMGHHEPWQ